MLSVEEIIAYQQATSEVYVDRALIEYAVRLVSAARRPGEHGLPELAPYVAFGASPRASISLVRAAQAVALLRGRAYALPQDLGAMAKDVLRHRLVLTYEALTEGVSADAILEEVFEAVVTPEIELGREESA